MSLPPGESASTLFLRLLRDARAAFPETLGEVDLPDEAQTFKSRYAAVLAEVEQRRASSSAATAIARKLSEDAQQALRFVDGDGERPLAELGSGLPLDVAEAGGGASTPGWRPEVELGGEMYGGHRLGEAITALEARHQVSRAMAAALRRSLERLGPDGHLQLSGERFALLGAGAEIAPTRHLLAAGATVLWCDVVPPPDALTAGPGRLVHTLGRADLLEVPNRVAGTVARFAEAEGPVHLGLFAYGPGKGREWRLAAAMNAVTRALPAEALRSVGLYVSPTTPARLPDEAAEVLRRRSAAPARGLRLLRAVGALTPNRSLPDHRPVADVVVPIQGVSYQAAQWVEKTLAMEALRAAEPKVRVSANVAPVTETRSLQHPVFAAAFRGAPIFGVSSFPPSFTRTLSALAYLEDVLGAEPAPGPKSLHGGLFTLPWTLESAIRVAAARGLFGAARLRT